MGNERQERIADGLREAAAMLDNGLDMGEVAEWVIRRSGLGRQLVYTVKMMEPAIVSRGWDAVASDGWED